jgi:hypothetical protein
MDDAYIEELALRHNEEDREYRQRQRQQLERYIRQIVREEIAAATKERT